MNPLKLTLGVITILCMLTGCATPYQKATLFNALTRGGGYYEKELPTGEYWVQFEGNGFTSINTVADYALLRCAELTLEKGASYFEIIEATGDYKMNSFSYSTGSKWGYSSGISIDTVFEYTIRLHKIKPEASSERVFDSQKELRSAFPRLRLLEPSKVFDAQKVVAEVRARQGLDEK